MACVKGEPEGVTVFVQQPISNTDNGVIDQGIIKTFVKVDEIVKDYYHRLNVHLQAVDPYTIPCIFIASKTCQASFKAAIGLGLVSRVEELSPLGVTACEISGRVTVVLEGRPHPSWHLMTGRKEIAKNAFNETIAMLNGMVRCCASGDITPASMTKSLMDALAIKPEELKRRAEGQSFLTQLLYGDISGRFPARHAHLRNVKVHLPDVKAMLLKWHARGMALLKAIILHGNLYLDLPSCDGELEYWFEKLGAKSFTTFMCNGLCDTVFKGELDHWFTKLGGAKPFTTFMCNGAASKLCDPTFKGELEHWFT
ncbi:hypothetical protein JKP88DRAFT_277274 [Tribonema minus]|uniref:Uncharacterized protein n=1 Tax=Tribonema minus TaxID=303371 RepID=A0A836CEY5_9STRA|nr:hypothetical protein JKP88DRAFT_277274 [Tribonema minus]